MKHYLYILVFMLFGTLTATAQRGYKKDSVQLKVYTNIKYVNNVPKKVDVRKVFCDYCSEEQLKAIEEEARRRTMSVRYDKENKMKNGVKKLTLYIRISKDDFAAINEKKKKN